MAENPSETLPPSYDSLQPTIHHTQLNTRNGSGDDSMSHPLQNLTHPPSYSNALQTNNSSNSPPPPPPPPPPQSDPTNHLTHLTHLPSYTDALQTNNSYTADNPPPPPLSDPSTHLTHLTDLPSYSDALQTNNSNFDDRPPPSYLSLFGDRSPSAPVVTLPASNSASSISTPFTAPISDSYVIAPAQNTTANGGGWSLQRLNTAGHKQLPIFLSNDGIVEDLVQPQRPSDPGATATSTTAVLQARLFHIVSSLSLLLVPQLSMISRAVILTLISLHSLAHRVHSFAIHQVVRR